MVCEFGKFTRTKPCPDGKNLKLWRLSKLPGRLGLTVAAVTLIVTHCPVF